MAASVKITRLDLDAAGLRAAAGLCRESAASRRMLALGLVLEGYSRTDAARLCGMDRQTLRDWVHRYNDLGLEGLTDRQYAGPKCRLSEAQQAQVRQWVEEGPDLKAHGVVRWRRIDLSRRIDRKSVV